MRGPLLAGPILAALLLCLLTGAGAAQELPLKRTLPPSPPELCPALPAAAVEPPSPAAAGEAQRLLADASQAAILGDPARALALLTAAAVLDPTSPALRYRLGRAMDEAGDEPGAIREFCAYLALLPDGPEAPELRERLEGTETAGLLAAEIEATSAFRDGIAAYDRGAFEDSAQHFSRALVLRADWEAAHYNRGLAYLRSGRTGAGSADLEWYLELQPEALDRSAVEARLASIQFVPRYSPGTALISGLLIPGMGQFYSGRPIAGTMVLVAAGGSAAAALLYREVEVSCLSLPIDGECPPGQIASREETRPLLVPGLAVAAAATLFGAVNAYRSARRAPSAALTLSPSGEVLVSVRRPGVASTLRFAPWPLAEAVGVRAGIELRF